MPELNGQSSDEKIAEKVQSGEIELFGVLAQRYEDKMLRYAKKFLFGYDDAEDLVQEVFLKAFVNIRSFDVSRKIFLLDLPDCP